MAYSPVTIPQSVIGSVFTYQQGTRITSISGIPQASVHGEVTISGTPNVNTAGSVVAFQGTDPWIITGSVQTTVSTSNSSVMLLNSPNAIGSVAVLQGTNPFIITGSVQTTVNTGNSSVQVLNFPTTQNVSGSVVAYQGTDPWIQTGSVQGTVSVLGTVPVTQSGTFNTSIVSTVPSSALVGASVFGIPNPLVITGSVQGAGAGTQYSEDAVAPADPTGTAQVLRRTDTPSVQSGDDGDWVVRNATNYGAAYTQILDSSGNYVDTFGGGTQYTEDAVAAGDPVGNAQIVVATSTPSIQGEDGDNVARRGTRYGAALTQIVDSSGALVDSFGGGSSSVVQQGTWRTSVISSTPSSMLVGASVFGNVGISGTPNVNTAGSVVAFQGTDPWIVDGSGSTQPISGNVGQTGTIRTSVVSSTPSSMLVGASVFGNVGISGTPNVNTAGSVVSFQGTDPWIITGSVQGTFNTGNSSVQVLNFPAIQDIAGSVIARNITPSSLLVGASIFGLAPVNVTNTNLNVSGSVAAFVQGTPNVNTAGSVVAFQGTDPWTVDGTVGATQSGAYRTSVISSTPSSMLVGASIFGLAPVNVTNTNLNVGGSVVSYQGTDPWIITGSVQGGGAGTEYTEDAVAAGDPVGGAQIIVATSTPSIQGEDGDNVARRGTRYGAALAQIIDSSGALIDTFGGGTQYTEDAVAAGDPVGTAQIVVATSTPSIQGEDGDNIARRGTRYGAAFAQIVDSSGALVDSFGGGTTSVIQQTIPWTISSIYGNISGSVVAFQGSGWSGSVAATITNIPQASVHGRVSVAGGNVEAVQSGAWNVGQTGTKITSIVSTVPSSVIVGASIFGLAPVNVTNTNVNVSGSVVAYQGSGWSGSVAAGQIGTQRTSVISSTPSSMLVGASIFGLAPVNITNTNVNVSGSVVASGTVTANQGTGFGSIASHIKSGSVIAVFGGNTSVLGVQSGDWNVGLVAPSIVGTYAEDAGHTDTNKGLFTLGVRNDAVASFVSTNLDYSPFGLDSAGRMLIKPFAAEESRVEGVASVVHTSVTTLVAAAGAGLRNYITDIALSNGGSVATTVTFRSQGGSSILGNFIVPSGGGNNKTFAVPIRTPANTTFDFQASTAVSVLYANVSGFKAP